MPCLLLDLAGCLVLAEARDVGLSVDEKPLSAVPQERFYFGDTVLPLFESGIPLVKEYLIRLPDADNITIAYPDEGAWKRFHAQLGEYPEVCTKSPGRIVLTEDLHPIPSESFFLKSQVGLFRSSIPGLCA